MNKSLIFALSAFLLSSCGGGYNGLAPQISDGNGGTIGAGGSLSSTGDSENGDWKYGDVSNEDGVYLLSARIDATNTYTVPQFSNLEQRSWIELERLKIEAGTISERFLIFAPEEVKCTPSCQIRIEFNGQISSYSFLQSSDGVLVPVSDQLSTELFDKTTESNSATVYLPIVGLSSEVESEFKLRGYDEDEMRFSDE